MHKKSNRQKSWNFHTKKGCYVGPTLNQYCCVRDVVDGTSPEKFSDTVRFKHHAISIPEITPIDCIVCASQDLEKALKRHANVSPNNELLAIERQQRVLMGEPAPNQPDRSSGYDEAAGPKPEGLKAKKQVRYLDQGTSTKPEIKLVFDQTDKLAAEPAEEPPEEPVPEQP